MPEAANSITAAQAAKLIKGAALFDPASVDPTKPVKAVVRLPKLDGDGDAILIGDGPDKGRFEIVERPIGEEDILAALQRGDQVTIVTVDGRKLVTGKKG